MDEPSYIFVKGVGWVPSNYEVYTFTHCGKTIEIVDKKPEIGEWGAHTYTGDSEFHSGGKQNFQRWAKWFSDGLLENGNHPWVKPVTAEMLRQADRVSIIISSSPAWVTFYVRD